MRKVLLSAFLFIGLILVSALTYSQNDRFAFVVTDLQNTGSSWNALRKMDLKTGEYSSVLLNGTDATLPVLDAISKKPYTSMADTRYGNYLQSPFSTGVAAMAYDKKNNRLYYTPMFIDQLRYVDLKTMKLYYVTDQAFTGFGSMHNDEGKIVTRMVITPDGTGYAITNDASSMIRFTTGKKIQISQLGALVDDPANGNVSIQNRCSSWGGDMIADDNGKLYLITARNSVYTVDIESKVATLLGYIKGLPQGFTSNGAVVNNEGKILVSSAVNAAAYYIVDPTTWAATEFKPAEGIFRSSDLANSNYLQTRPRNNTTEIVTRRAPENPVNDKIIIYPNPVTHKQFTLQYGKISAGNYNLELTDVTGRLIMQKTLNIAAEGQVETISLKPTTAGGVYLLKISDQKGTSVISQKLVVQ